MGWKFTDKSYELSTCTAKVDGESLVVKLSGHRRKPFVHVIEDFGEKTALEALAEHGATSGDAYLGRHYEDCVFAAYHDLGLDLGFMMSPPKPLSAREDSGDGDWMGKA